MKQDTTLQAGNSLSPHVLKLAHGATFDDEDRAILATLARVTTNIPAHQDLIAEGDNPEYVHLIVNGFAYRYKLMVDGKRQIVAILVPGDFCDMHVAILGRMDHSIATLSNCTVSRIPRDVVEKIATNYPRVNRAMLWATLVDEGTLREWIVNIGQRDAAQRMAHLFCEVHLRMASVGLAEDGVFRLPINQSMLGEALGITAIHANRALQSLRASQLLQFKSGIVDIYDVARLRKFCDFTGDYLHLRDDPVADSANNAAS